MRPTFTYNTYGDLRNDLQLYSQGCVNNWNNGCHNIGTLHENAGNAAGKMWESQQMIPVGGLRKTPIMSAKLMTTKAFHYGRIEIAATLPEGDYLWPALWMLPENSGPWPTSGEIDIMESMGNHWSSSFDLDSNSASSALHFGESSSWYDIAYTPMFEKLLDIPFGTLSNRRKLKKGPHIFGVYWNYDNIYMYIDGDANRILDMDVMFRLKAKEILALEPLNKVAQEVSNKGYMAGWRMYSQLCGKEVPDYLWQESLEGVHDAPFNRPFYLIMNLAVGGNFFGLNKSDKNKPTQFDIHPKDSGQLPSMYWYSRMNQWWSTWAANKTLQLPEAFEKAPNHLKAYYETQNTWNEYANGGQDAEMINTHKADILTNKKPPKNNEIGEHVNFKIHRVVVYSI